MDTQSEWLTRQQVADEYPIAVATLARWAWQGTGPEYARAGRKTLYKRSDIEGWLEKNRVRTAP